MSSIPTKQISGDAAVGRNVSAGGNANIQGNVRVGHDLKVGGWLDAPNIKGPAKGLFASEASLKAAYLFPQPGWWALVGDTLPAPVWIVENGQWKATGKQSGSLTLANEQLSEDVDELSQALAELRILFNALESGTDSTNLDGFNKIVAFLTGLKTTDTLAAKLNAIVSRANRIMDFDGEVNLSGEIPTGGGKVYWVEAAKGFRSSDAPTNPNYAMLADYNTADGGRTDRLFRKGNELYIVSRGKLVRMCHAEDLKALRQKVYDFRDELQGDIDALRRRIVDFDGIVDSPDELPSTPGVFWVTSLGGFRDDVSSSTFQGWEDYNLDDDPGEGREDCIFRCENALYIVNGSNADNLVRLCHEDDLAAIQSAIGSVRSDLSSHKLAFQAFSQSVSKRLNKLASRIVDFDGICDTVDDVPVSNNELFYWVTHQNEFRCSVAPDDPTLQVLQDYNNTDGGGLQDRLFCWGNELYMVNGENTDNLVRLCHSDDIARLQASVTAIEDRIGSPGGIAELDNAGLVPRSQLPGAVVEFAGFAPAGAEVTVGSAADGFPVFNAATNRFICPDGSGVKPKYYCNWADGDLYGTASATGRIPLQGILYADNASGITYRWDGESFIPAASHTTPEQLNAAAKQLFIRQWNLAAGEYGRYNEETGYFELYGITDISFHEALEIYLRYRYIYKTRDQLPTSSNNLKTLLPIYGLLNLQVGINEAFIGLKATELAFRCNVGTRPFETGNAYRAFFMCHQLEVIHGSIYLSKTANVESMFGDCPALREVRIYNLCKSLYLASSPNISLATLQCLVWNAANTTAITVTVHPAVFAKLNPPEGASEEALQWAQLVEDAAAKNITFAIP